MLALSARGFLLAGLAGSTAAGQLITAGGRQPLTRGQLVVPSLAWALTQWQPHNLVVPAIMVPPSPKFLGALLAGSSAPLLQSYPGVPPASAYQHWYPSQWDAARVSQWNAPAAQRAFSQAGRVVVQTSITSQVDVTHNMVSQAGPRVQASFAQQAAQQMRSQLDNAQRRGVETTVVAQASGGVANLGNVTSRAIDAATSRWPAVALVQLDITSALKLLIVMVLFVFIALIALALRSCGYACAAAKRSASLVRDVDVLRWIDFRCATVEISEIHVGGLYAHSGVALLLRAPSGPLLRTRASPSAVDTSAMRQAVHTSLHVAFPDAFVLNVKRFDSPLVLSVVSAGSALEHVLASVEISAHTLLGVAHDRKDGDGYQRLSLPAVRGGAVGSDAFVSFRARPNGGAAAVGGYTYGSTLSASEVAIATSRGAPSAWVEEDEDDLVDATGKA